VFVYATTRVGGSCVGVCLNIVFIKNTLKTTCALCADGMIMERRYYKPELLNELRTEVFDKMGLNYSLLKTI
jgi:hypothetical protein